MAEPQSSVAQSSTQDDSLSGTLVAARYLVKERLGQGSMGEVYRAEDAHLKKVVALKRLSPALRRDGLYRRRFREEAGHVSRINVPHVAAIYDVIEENDESFLVMEFIEGETLRQRQRRKGRPLTLDEFLNIAMQCVEALVAAHKRGIVHSDIKPENIMIDVSSQVKILDFGVAKHLPGSEESSTIDRAGTMSGTPAYMAPEVLLQRRPDGRADIFSLGIVFYEVLTGKHPFLAESFIATSDRIRNETPAPISDFNAKLPFELQNVADKMLAKDPDDRYASAELLLQDLRYIQQVKTHLEIPLPSWTPKPWWRKHWIPLATVPLVVVLLLALWQVPAIQTAVKNVIWPPPPVKPTFLAVLPFTPSSDDPNARAFSKGLSATLALRLAQLTGHYPMQVVPPDEVNKEEIQNAEQARKNFGVNLVLEGSLRESGKQTRISYTLIDPMTKQQLKGETITVDSSDPFAIEDHVLESIVSQLGLVLEARDKNALLARPTQQPAAYDYYLRGRGYLQGYQKRENLESAITVFQHALERDPNYALAYAGSGEAQWRLYELTQDGTLVERADTNCKRSIAQSGGVASGHVCLGLVYTGTGRYVDAANEFERAIQLDATNDDAYRGLGSVYQHLGKFEQAEKTYLRAIQLRPQYFGGYAWLGALYWSRARYEDAARMFTTQIALAPDNYRGYNNLCGMYIYQGRYADAIPQAQRSIAIEPNADGYSNLGTAYFFLGQFADAVATYKTAIATLDSDYAVWGNLAEAYYWQQGARGQAFETYKKAISLTQASIRVNPKDAYALYHAALYYAMQQQRAPALTYLQRAVELTPNDPELLFTAGKIYAQLGQKSEAIASLRAALSAGYPENFVRDDPLFASLAADVLSPKTGGK
jgi:serine/threonine protein kinase/Flp pilus assembly protein TadD